VMILNMGENTNASNNGRDNVAMNTRNASNHLLEVGTNLPPPGDVTP
jgi:hypothetical protein